MNLIYGTTNCYDKMILDRKRKQANESANQAGQCIEPPEVSNRIIELQKAMPTASALTWYNALLANGVSSFSKQELYVICEQIRKLKRIS